jgi:hypothetical protein
MYGDFDSSLSPAGQQTPPSSLPLRDTLPVLHCRSLGGGTAGVNSLTAAMGGGGIQSEACSAACSGLAANEKHLGSGFLKEPVSVLEKGETP